VASGARFAGLVKAAQAGIQIGFGTDSGSPVVQHDVVALELEFILQLAIKRTAAEAIESATSVAARINRLDHLTGRLGAGLQADVVIVEGRPDVQIQDIARVQRTDVGGRQLF
jgi:imidazolonepropionase-like amidohydrolase